MGKSGNKFFRIPKIKDDVMKIVCVLLNVFISGTGTILGAVLDGMDVNVILCGVLQLLCGSFFLGYVWSWVWAYFIAVQKQVC